MCFMPTLNIWEFTFMLFTKGVTNCALDVKFISTKDQWSNIMTKIIIFYAVHFSLWEVKIFNLNDLALYPIVIEKNYLFTILLKIQLS